MATTHARIWLTRTSGHAGGNAPHVPRLNHLHSIQSAMCNPPGHLSLQRVCRLLTRSATKKSAGVIAAHDGECGCQPFRARNLIHGELNDPGAYTSSDVVPRTIWWDLVACA